MSFNITTAFGQHSGSTLLKAAQSIARQVINGNPVKNDDGSTSKDDSGQAYVDIDKAHSHISDQQAGLQERVMRDLKGPISASGAQDIRENLGNLRKLEVAQVCLDIICAAESNDARSLNTQLNNAMQGLHPTNPKQSVSSRSLESTLNSKLEPKAERHSRVDVQIDHHGTFK